MDFSYLLHNPILLLVIVFVVGPFVLGAIREATR